MALNPEQEWEYFVSLDEKGVTQVRYELEHGQIPPANVHLATKWLSEKGHEAEVWGEAQSEQMELIEHNSASVERAELANAKANIAIVAAVVSLIVSIVFSVFTLVSH